MKKQSGRRKFLIRSVAAGFGLSVFARLPEVEAGILPPQDKGIPPGKGSNTSWKRRSQVKAYSSISFDEQKWTSKELWDQSISRGLALDDDAIVLDDHILVENDSAGLGSIEKDVWEIIKSDVILRKRLVVPRWPVREAILTMMVYPVKPQEPMSGGKLEIYINNMGPVVHEVRHAWTSVPIPAKYLRPGENKIEITVNGSETEFRIPISQYSHYKYGSPAGSVSGYRSERSSDGGSSWTHQELGVSNNIRGEYPIRLKLRAYEEEGWMETPIIHLGNSPVKGVLSFPSIIEFAKLDLKADTFKGGKLLVKARSGNTHHPEVGRWSDWEVLEQEILPADLRENFVQFRIQFTSNAGDVSPQLYNLEFHSRAQSVEPNNARDEIFVIDALNRPLVPSSFKFQYEDPTHPALQELRANYKFDEVVKEGRTELEKIMLLRGWVAGQWDWFMRSPEKSFLTTWDAREILEGRATAEGSAKSGGYCLHYAIVLAQACQSLGIPARIVNTNFAIYGGHEVVEIWSRDYEKWIFVDPNFDTMFVCRENGIPLNVLELHEVFLDTYYPNGEVIDRDSWTYEDRDRRAGSIDPADLPIRMEIGGHALSGSLKDYVWWKVTDSPVPGYAGGYGFFNTAYIRWLPRSNWMSEPFPTPINHGRTHWGWEGYLAWTDSQTPETPEHRHFVRRESDMYGSLFCVDFRAQATEPGLLQVFMATDTPGFSHFEVDENGHKTDISEDSFTWQLAPGINTLALRSVDALSNKGPISELTINYMPK